jgi:hypothetical protein
MSWVGRTVLLGLLDAILLSLFVWPRRGAYPEASR